MTDADLKAADIMDLLNLPPGHPEIPGPEEAAKMKEELRKLYPKLRSVPLMAEAVWHLDEEPKEAS